MVERWPRTGLQLDTTTSIKDACSQRKPKKRGEKRGKKKSFAHCQASPTSNERRMPFFSIPVQPITTKNEEKRTNGLLLRIGWWGRTNMGFHYLKSPLPLPSTRMSTRTETRTNPPERWFNKLLYHSISEGG